MRIHLVGEDDRATLCGKSTDEVVDCIDVEFYVDHYSNGTEDEMFTLAQSAMVLMRLVLSILDVDAPEPELPDSDSPMCEECNGYAGFEILARYATEQDED